MFTPDTQNLVILALTTILVAATLQRDFRRFALSYAICIPAGILLVYLFNTSVPVLVIVLSVVSAKYLYSNSFFAFAPFIFVTGAFLMLNNAPNIQWEIFDISIGLGTSVSLITDRESLGRVSANNNSKGKSKAKEISRDLVQIAAGLLILILLLGMGQDNFRMTIGLAIVPLYIFGNYYSMFPQSTVGRTLSFFERPMTPLGLGAIWFAAGISISIGLVQSTAMLALIVFVTTIGDPLATIFGSMIKSPKLPYNRKKSLAGFMGIFIFSAIFGYFLLGFTGIGVALFSAVLESISFHPLDDNFILPVVLGAISYVV